MKIIVAFCIILVGCMFEVPQPSSSMPAAQAPSATPTFPNTISPPLNGDPLDATQLNSDVETPLQNGVEAARVLLYGGGINRRVSCTSNTVMVIQPLGAVLAAVGGTVWTAYPNTTPTTIDPAALSAGLAASTRYWVYAKLTAGPAFAFIVSTTAPDAGFFYMTGDKSALWISTFVTDGSSNIVLYEQTGKHFMYSVEDTTNLVLSGGSTSGAIALGVLVPSQSCTYKVLCNLEATSAGASVFVSASGFVGRVAFLSSATTATSAVFEREITTTNTLSYGGSGTYTASVFVMGFDL